MYGKGTLGVRRLKEEDERDGLSMISEYTLLSNVYYNYGKCVGHIMAAQSTWMMDGIKLFMMKDLLEESMKNLSYEKNNRNDLVELLIMI